MSDPNFFQSVHAKLVEAKTNFIEADLSAMRLRVYPEQSGESGEFPILTIGKPGVSGGRRRRACIG